MLKILTLLITLSLSQSAYSAASPAPTPPAHEQEKVPEIAHSEQGNYQQVIDEYKTYVATVDQSVRDEIVDFRKEMARLNKQKHTAYKKLSQEAQHYLAKERELKRKLPVDQRKALKDDTADIAAAE